MRTAIARFLQFLAVERNASAHTVKSYREDLSALVDYLSETHGERLPKPGEITVLDLRGYVAALHDAGYAKSSIARHLATLRTFFRFGQREGWAKTNPAKPLRTPRKGRTLPHFLSAEDLGRLFQAPSPDDPMGLRDRAILETMYSAGLRVSEVVGLDDADLDFDAEILRIRGKGRRERLAPVGSYALRALRRWLGVRRLHAGHKGPRNGAGVRQQVRAAIHHAKRRTDVGKVSKTDRPRRTHVAPFAAAQLCHAPVGPRRRHTQRPGIAGPQESHDNANLYARRHVGLARSLRAGASASKTVGKPSDQTEANSRV